MNIDDSIKKDIIKSLEPLNPEKIILFGSFAWGMPDESSDIDLYIVTQDNFMPGTFSEKMELKLSVAKHLLEFRKKFSTDLLVHTRPMHKKFLELNSSFSRQLMSEGIALL
jgi:uncharacterized protein